jgi:hypothetical protein
VTKCTCKCEQVREQMLKMKPQHRKQGNREHVQCVQCAVCIVRTVYSTCKWDRIVRTVVSMCYEVTEWGHDANYFSSSSPPPSQEDFLMLWLSYLNRWSWLQDDDGYFSCCFHDDADFWFVINHHSEEIKLQHWSKLTSKKSRCMLTGNAVFFIGSSFRGD